MFTSARFAALKQPWLYVPNTASNTATEPRPGVALGVRDDAVEHALHARQQRLHVCMGPRLSHSDATQLYIYCIGDHQ